MSKRIQQSQDMAYRMMRKRATDLKRVYQENTRLFMSIHSQKSEYRQRTREWAKGGVEEDEGMPPLVREGRYNTEFVRGARELGESRSTNQEVIKLNDFKTRRRIF